MFHSELTVGVDTTSNIKNDCLKKKKKQNPNRIEKKKNQQ